MIPTEAVGKVLSQSGFFHRSPSAFSATRSHKEWVHFAVHAEGVHILVNLSVMDDTRAGGAPGAEVGRVTCLVWTDTWDGDIDSFSTPALRIHHGVLDAQLGDSSVRLESGGIHLRAKLARRPIEVDLMLHPKALPTESHNVVFDDCPPLSWLVVPRLSATGTVRVGERLHELVDAPAYHDHNWGSFRWGKNFAWEWGYGVPLDAASPFSLVYVRFTDRGRRAELSRGLFVFREEYQTRIFLASELSIEREGHLAKPRVFSLPRALSVALPSGTNGIPKRLLVRASGRGDRLDLVFTAEDVARILAPNDDDLGVTVINEVIGTLEARGTIHGERVQFTTPTTFEFLTDA